MSCHKLFCFILYFLYQLVLRANNEKRFIKVRQSQQSLLTISRRSASKEGLKVVLVEGGKVEEAEERKDNFLSK